MVCPLCRARKSRRSCPALGQQICPLCCGTKRRVEIACPETCGWLRAAETHPAAVEQRRRERDLEAAAPLGEARSREQRLILTAVLDATTRYADAAVPHLTDRDVAEAAEALAATYETSARGIIYDHQPASLPAQRLLTAYREALETPTPRQRPASFERAAALALRRVRDAARNFGAREETTETAFLDWLRRVGAKQGGTPASLVIDPGSAAFPPAGEPSESDSEDTGRIIVP
ncbi:MAG: hypothetical protein GEV06_07645 [Luteitalea sp.]|nr:hypothetical protein [Luteitalea sp.]